MICFKSCPRCDTGAVVADDTGAVVADKDIFGEHVMCLQCGYMKDLDDAYRFEDFQGHCKLLVIIKRESEPEAV